MSEQPDFSKGISKGMGMRDSVSSLLDANRRNLKDGKNFVSEYWPEMLLGGIGIWVGATLLGNFDQQIEEDQI